MSKETRLVALEKIEREKWGSSSSAVWLLSGELAYAFPISYSQRLIKYSEHSGRAKNMIQ